MYASWKSNVWLFYSLYATYLMESYTFWYIFQMNKILKWFIEHDPILQRNRNLSNPANLANLLEDAAIAVDQYPRVRGVFNTGPHRGLRLAILLLDGRHIRVPHSTDYYFQRRTHSTKIHNNAVVKLTVADVTGMPLFSTPLSASFSPAGKKNLIFLNKEN